MKRGWWQAVSWARFVAEAEKRGAKLVLVGDHEQLQAIGAGSPFRAIAERIGSVELTDIRRQKGAGSARPRSPLPRIARRTDCSSMPSETASVLPRIGSKPVPKLIRDYLVDRAQNRRAHALHWPIGVSMSVRSMTAFGRGLQAEGLLAKAGGQQDVGTSNGGERTDREIVYQTVNGKRAFAPGDRIVLLENSRILA